MHHDNSRNREPTAPAEAEPTEAEPAEVKPTEAEQMIWIGFDVPRRDPHERLGTFLLGMIAGISICLFIALTLMWVMS